MKSTEELKQWWDETYTSMREWFDQIYSKMFDQISSRTNTILIQSFNSKSPNEEVNNIDIDFVTDECIRLFYIWNDGWKIRWKTKLKKTIKFEADGEFNLLPLQEIFADHWDETWSHTWEGTEIAEDMVGFRPLDSFYEGAGIVGFYINRIDKKGLYLYKEEGEPEPLHVDFEGYLKLLTLSKGFGWWQNALIEINTGVHQPNTDAFRKNMPKIFPEFNWDEFVTLYQSVRIDK